MSIYKSKVTEIFDFKRIDLGPLMLPFELDEEKLEKDINLVIKKRAKLIEADQIEVDDFATISCRSEARKYNKSRITLRVGKQLYSKELENQLVGMKKGESYDITVDGYQISVEVLKVERAEVPELNDANVALWGIEGIKTVEELRNSFIEEQHRADIEETVESVASYVQSAAVSQSLFKLDEDEEAEQIEFGKSLAVEMLKAQGVIVESPEAQQYIDEICDMMLTNLKSGVIGQALMDADGRSTTDKDYEAALEEEMEYGSISKEEAMSILPREAFEKQFASNYYVGKIAEHIRKYIEEKEY